VHVALAEHDCARVEQLLDDGGISCGPLAGKPRRAAGGRQIGSVEVVL
jgi:hypothetical protein